MVGKQRKTGRERVFKEREEKKRREERNTKKRARCGEEKERLKLACEGKPEGDEPHGGLLAWPPSTHLAAYGLAH